MITHTYGDVTDIRGAVMQAFRQLGRGIRCAEVGVKDGQHAKIMLDLLRPSVMLLVDVWEDIVLEGDTYCFKAYEECRALLTEYPQCRYVRGRSEVLLPDMPTDSLDFTYIDAAHDPQSVATDVRNCVRIVRAGGIVGGHDYASVEPMQGVELGVHMALHGVQSVGRDEVDRSVSGDWWVTVTPEMKESARNV